MPARSLPNSSTSKPLILAALLLGYSNGLGWWAMRKGHSPDRLFLKLNPLLAILLLGYAAGSPGGLAASGLRRKGLGKSIALGAGAGLALAIPPLTFFHRPVVLDTPLEYGPVVGMSNRELAIELFVRLPLAVATLEELAFRGLLYGMLRRRYSPVLATVVSAAGFGGWHFVVTAASARQTNLSGAKIPLFLRPYIPQLATAGGMLSTAIAGAIFAGVREQTGNLAGPIVAHWLVDALMIAALWRKAREQRN